MNNSAAVFRKVAPLLAAVLMIAPAAAGATSGDDAPQRLLQRLARGDSVRQDIEALQAHRSHSASDASRAAEARQLEQAQHELMRALRAFIEQGGATDSLSMRYDAWRAAAQVVQIKIAAQGERLRSSADGGAHVARHAAAQADVAAAFAQVQALLDPILGPRAPGAPEPAPAHARSAAAEALALLQRQRTRPAQAPILRAQPVPFGGLNLPPRQPLLTPLIVPSYATPSEVTPTVQDRSATAQAPLSDEIIGKARALDNNYVRLYEYVRNSVRNEWYPGAVKGAVGVLRSGAGNDIDQASLLTALLRAAGLNTRYVQGAVELPLERVAAELGLPSTDSAAVPAALAKAGVAFSPVVRGGRIAAVQVTRTWISAYVPYTNYRGALVDASGKSWIPLDPFHKAVTVTPSTGFFAKNLDAGALATDYLTRSRREPFADFLRQNVQAALAARGTAGSWDAQRATSTTAALVLDILPNSLPYTPAAITHEAADLPASEQASVRIRLHQGPRVADPVVLDKTLPLADAVNARLTLSYGPASIEDHRVALLYGGMDAVPLYLIGLRGHQRASQGSDVDLIIDGERDHLAPSVHPGIGAPGHCGVDWCSQHRGQRRLKLPLDC